MIYKDEGTIHIDKLTSVKTSEHNGLEVSCIIERNYSNATSLSNGIQLLSYFPNIYIENKTNIVIPQNFNNRVIKDFKTFKYCTLSDATTISCEKYNKYYEYKVLYGNVLYPIKFPDVITLDFLPKCLNLCIKFDIGELDITPSRESLQMTKRTISAISNKIKEFKNEIDELIKKSIGEFTDFRQVFDPIFAGIDNSGPIGRSFGIKLDTVTLNTKESRDVILVMDSSSKLLDFIKTQDFKIINKDTGNIKVIPAKYVATILNFICDTSREFLLPSKLFYKRHIKSYSEEYINIYGLIKSIIGGYYIVTDKTFSAQLRMYINEVKTSHTRVVKKEDEKGFLKDFIKKFSTFLDSKQNLSINQSEIKDLLFYLKKWYDSKRTVICKSNMPDWVIAKYKFLHQTKEPIKKQDIKRADIAFYGILSSSIPGNIKLKKLNSDNVKDYEGQVVIIEGKSEYEDIIINLFKHICRGYTLIGLPKERILFCVVAKNKIKLCKELGFCMVEDFLNSETNKFFRKLAAFKLWLTKNNIEISKCSDLLRKARYGNSKYSEIDDKRLAYLKGLYYLCEYNWGEALTEVIDTCISNGFIDWKFYCKMPSKQELLLLNLQGTTSITSSLSYSLIMLELMRRKLITNNFTLYKTFKKEIDEHIKSW